MILITRRGTEKATLPPSRRRRGVGWEFLVMADRSSRMEKHRNLVGRWLAEQPEVTVVEVGSLVDAWR